MKKIIAFAACACVALVSCVNNESEISATANKEVKFQTAVYAVSRANVTYDNNLTFGTYSWHLGQDGATVTPFMTNEEVSYQTDAWKTVGTTFYWPKTGSLSFFSYSPYTVDLTSDVTETTMAFADYVVEDKTSVDLMYADKVSGLTANTLTYQYSGVPTLFRHALAKVNFAIKAAYLTDGNAAKETTWEVTVNKVELLDITNNGTLALAWNGTKWNGAWAAATTQSVINPVMSSTDIALTTTAQEVNSNYFVMPQTLNNQKMRLTLTIVTKRAGSAVLTENNVVVEANLKNTVIAEWGMNKNITYNVTLTPTAGSSTTDPSDATITFDPAVEDWESVAGGDINF